MSEDNEILGVALVKEICMVCGKLFDGPIIMNTKLTKANAKKVREMHGKALNYMQEPCSDCKDMMSKGFVLIGAVEKKTTDVSNPYRTGNIWVVKQEVADKLFAPNPPPASGVSFIDINIAKEMELPDCNMNA